MDETIASLVFKLHVVNSAKYDMDGLFDKTRDDFEREIAEMPDSEKVELLEEGNEVDESFEEGGRWSNFRTRVFRHYFEGEFVYVSVSDEVPATEMQDGGDFMEPNIERVYPKKIETTVYTTEKPEPSEGNPKGKRK
ncbi:hypothetical protein [Salibacterium lacus]|uniref:Uncharacterized protein n=1 Tax=Salibacterium lacus TaxID=1898109 RepID=A0ABW5SY38_9BACI